MKQLIISKHRELHKTNRILNDIDIIVIILFRPTCRRQGCAPKSIDIKDFFCLFYSYDALTFF